MRGRPAPHCPGRDGPAADVLIVNNQNVINLDSEESRDFPFYGNAEQIEAEIKEVQLLLMKPTPPPVSGLGVAASPTSTSSSQGIKENKPWVLNNKKEIPNELKKSNSLIKASYGHSAERVKEITEDNNRLVKKLVGKANAPATFKSTASEHDNHLARRQASSIRLRQKTEESIIAGNLWLYRKLQSVQASSNVDRSALQQFYATSRKYLPQKKREGPSVVPPGEVFQKSSWNNRWHVVEHSHQ